MEVQSELLLSVNFFLNSCSRGLVSYLTRWLLTLQLFKNSIDTQEKLRLNLHSLIQCECEWTYRIRAFDLAAFVCCWITSFRYPVESKLWKQDDFIGIDCLINGFITHLLFLFLLINFLTGILDGSRPGFCRVKCLLRDLLQLKLLYGRVDGKGNTSLTILVCMLLHFGNAV
jgi:hypothetical protein